VRGFDTEHTRRGKGTRKRGGRKGGKAERQDALRKQEPWSGLTPDGATVWAPGAVRAPAAYRGLLAGLWRANRREGAPPGWRAGAEAALRWQRGCSQGQAGE